MTVCKKKKTYTFEEAYEATLNYFDGDALAARVWVSKYAMKDGMGHIYEQTPTDMHWRIAHEIARIETNYPHPLTPRRCSPFSTTSGTSFPRAAR